MAANSQVLCAGNNSSPGITLLPAVRPIFVFQRENIETSFRPCSTTLSRPVRGQKGTGRHGFGTPAEGVCAASRLDCCLWILYASSLSPARAFDALHRFLWEAKVCHQKFSFG